MESKLNNSSIEAYCVTFSSIICNQFFSKQTHITGQQILDLCKIKQINLFVLKNLFVEWKVQAEKFKSPYFDFENTEVERVYEDFKNILSQNIKIDRLHFEPLLNKAVHETIILLFSPYHFFQKEVINNSSVVSYESIKETAKYVKINSHLSEAILNRMENRGSNALSGDAAIKMLNEVCEQTTHLPDDFEEYLKKFSEIHPLSVEMIYTEISNQVVPEVSKPSKDFFSESLHNIGSDEAAPVPSLNEKFYKKQLTLNEKLYSAPRATIAEMHYQKKIESIKQSLTINQKFMFIKELFKGNTEEFNQAMENLDRCGSYDEALDYLKKNHAGKYNWNMEGEEAGELFGLVQKKYPQ